MGNQDRYRNPRGGTAPQAASPLPAGYAPDRPVVPVQIVNGFTFSLPGRDRLFFQRVFFERVPKPIQVAGPSPFPRRIPIATIEAPKKQAIVIRTVAFKAFQHSGIAVEDIIEVPSTRVTTYLGFQFQIGNRGMTDFMTNVPAAGVPVVFSPAQAGITAPRPGQGNLFPFSGPITPDMPGENFATYAMPGDQISAAVVIFRPPNFDLRLFSVEISGWLTEAVELQRIIDHVKGR